MRARKLNRRVEIYQITSVPDGHGGNLVSTELLSKSWCRVRTLSVDRVINLGLNENRTVIEVKLRNRNKVNYSIKNHSLRYRGSDFNIIRIDPVNFENVEVVITAVSRDIQRDAKT